MSLLWTNSPGALALSRVAAGLKGPLEPVHASEFAHEIPEHEGWTDQFRKYDGKYLLHETGRNLIVAHRIGKRGIVHPDLTDPRDREGFKLPKPRRAGYLSWFGGKIDRKPDGTPDDRSSINGGRIYKTYVSGPHRRKGVASAMLAMARERHPEMEIRHSNALSDDGRAWAEATP
jgi:GNAT superfamily N-acetyltransferase